MHILHAHTEVCYLTSAPTHYNNTSILKWSMPTDRLVWRWQRDGDTKTVQENWKSKTELRNKNKNTITIAFLFQQMKKDTRMSSSLSVCPILKLWDNFLSSNINISPSVIVVCIICHNQRWNLARGGTLKSSVTQVLDCLSAQTSNVKMSVVPHNLT